VPSSLQGGTSFAFIRRDGPMSGSLWMTAQEVDMLELTTLVPLAAAGWAFLVWLFGGGLGLALIVFLVLKMFGK
jgi:hypothetical protein